MFELRTPLFLILLLAIPLLIFLHRRTNVVAAKWRRWTTLFLRCAALLCAILALANLHTNQIENRLAILFLLDTSESIEPSQFDDVIQLINGTVSSMKPTDQYGVIGFAKKSSLLIGVRPVSEHQQIRFDSIESLHERNATDILTSINQSLQLLPDNYHRRIVLFSDGIHNIGNKSLTDLLPLYSTSSVEIMTLPLLSIKDKFRVNELKLPNRVRKGQRFPIKAIIDSDGSLPNVNASLYHNGHLISDVEIPTEKGRTVFSFRNQQVWEDYPHRFQIKLDITDEIQENNQSYGIVQIEDKPNILYVEGDLEHADHLNAVLQENGLLVKVISASEMPTDIISLQHYDGLILSNVPIRSFSKKQLELIEVYVRDLGHGLVVIGGERAYGPGGYTDTTLETILPLEMMPKEQKDSVAIVFAIDTSGSMANFVGSQKKIELAIEAIRAGIRNLEGEDHAAVIGFDAELRDISPLTPDHDRLIKVVGKLKPTGGTSKIAAAISKARDYLNPSDIKRKHVILLSDGKSNEQQSDILQQARKCAEVGIGITTIAIGDAVRDSLEEIAKVGNGRSVYVIDIHELPEVLMDAVRDTHNYIVQEEFQPTIIDSKTSILNGIEVLPQLYGYVATTEKPAAQVYIKSHKEEPILASWNYGLGKSIAWTSDVKPAWSKEWITSTDFGRFWGQLINWSLPNGDIDTGFDLIVSNRNGNAKIVIETQKSSDEPFIVHVAGPIPGNQIVEMRQVTPRRYEGISQMSDVGSYIVTAKREGEERKRIETISNSYPVEYADFQLNSSLLNMLAKETGGTYGPTMSQITDSSGTPIENKKPFYKMLLIVALVLFTFEMILRRFSIASGYLNELRTQLRKKSEKVIPETLSQLTEKKSNINPVADTSPYTAVDIPTTREHTTNPMTSPTILPDSSDGTMSRLLAVKKRSRP